MHVAGEELSERELEILRLVATGVTNREIALRLAISPNTVKVHLRNIFAKIDVESRTEATMVAVRNGWVQVPNITPGGAVRPESSLLSWRRRGFLVAAVALAASLAAWPKSTGRALGRDALSDPGPVVSGSTDPYAVQRWSARAPMGVARQRFACASHEGLLYIIGGDTATGASRDLEVYDPSTDQWEERSSKPTAASNVSAAVLNGEIWVPGGTDEAGRTLSVLEVYDPCEDIWREASPLPEPRSAYALTAAEGRLYLFGGWDGSRFVPDVLIYDPEQDCWSVGTPLQQARGFAAAAALDGYIYLAGGYDGAAELAVFEVYDPALEGSEVSPWAPLAPMSQARGGLAMVTAGRRLYVVGGGWNGSLAYNESFDPAQGCWQSFPSPVLGQWRTLGLGVADSAMGTTLYALGGWAGDRVAINQAYRALLNVYLPQLP